MLKNYNRPWFFFSVSIIIPWILLFLAGYLSHRTDSENHIWLQSMLMLSGLLAPIFTALFLYLRNPILLQDLKNKFFHFEKKTWIYLILSIVVPFSSIILAQLISILFWYSWDQFYISGQPTFSSALFSAWFVLIFAAIMEEIAWHSYWMDSLFARKKFFIACIIFALYWAFWHSPLATIKWYYHSNLVTEWWLYSLNFVVSMFVFVFLINYFYLKSGRNIWVAIIFHAVANVSNELFATDSDTKIIQTWLFIIFFLIVVYFDRKTFFEKIEN